MARVPTQCNIIEIKSFPPEKVSDNVIPLTIDDKTTLSNKSGTKTQKKFKAGSEVGQISRITKVKAVHITKMIARRV